MLHKFLLSILCLAALGVTAAFADPVPAPAEAAKKPNDAPWTNVYADKKWYTDLPGKEEIFYGTLTVQRALLQASAFTRAHRYELGQMLIYPDGANKELDALVGETVEIHGKVCDATEGHFIISFYPGAIRRAAATQPATAPASAPAVTPPAAHP